MQQIERAPDHYGPGRVACPSFLHQCNKLLIFQSLLHAITQSA